MASGNSRDYRLISCNDHIILPPDAFDGQLSRADRERIKVEMVEGPASTLSPGLARHYIAQGRGDEIVRGHRWNFDGTHIYTRKISAVDDTSRLTFDDIVPPFDYATLPAHFLDPIARLEVLDRDRVIKSALYPMVEFPGYGAQHLVQSPDRAFALRVVQAYNNWLIDDFVAKAPDRYIALAALPLWDPQACAAEIERTVAKGARGIVWVDDPYRLGLPSLYSSEWDVVYAAAQDADVPLCVHVGAAGWAPPGAPDRPGMAYLNLISPVLPTLMLADVIEAQIFIRFPRLKMILNEVDIGWLPHALGRMDFMWHRHGMSGGPGWVSPTTPEPPSTYIPGHMWFSLNIAYEKFGPSIIREIGVDRVVMDIDFPHPDSSYGETTELVDERLGHLDDDELHTVLRGNAEGLFKL